MNNIHSRRLTYILTPFSLLPPCLSFLSLTLSLSLSLLCFALASYCGFPLALALTHYLFSSSLHPLSLSFFFFFLFFLCLALAGYRDFPLALTFTIFFFPLAFSLFLSLSVPANTFKREKSMISGSTLPLSTVAPVDALPRQQLSSPFVAHFSLRVFQI